MPIWLPYFLAFLSASLITYYRLYTSEKFHNFFFLIGWEPLVLIEVMIYGIIGVILLCILKDKVIAITNDKTTIGNYLYPLLVGAMTKGISDINLFNVKTDGFSFPVGLRTVTQPIDKFFEEKLDGICFPKTMAYQHPYRSKYEQEFSIKYQSNVNVFKAHVIHQLELYHPDKKKVKTFEQNRDFRKATNPAEILVLVLGEFGRRVFEAVFPL
jgi:hypothetical protein